MKKKSTCVYINNEIIEYCKKFKINLSEWINTEFTKKNLNIQSKMAKIQQLQVEIDQIKERTDIINKSLTQRELRYICQVTARIKEGKNISALWRRFNIEYNSLLISIRL